MSKFLILGGQQKSKIDAYNTPEWKGYARGIALEMEYKPGRSVIKKAFDYTSPPQNRNETEDASVLFKAGQINKNNIVVCTQTEVLIYSTATYELTNVVSLPCFNDIHHARFSKTGNLLVVVTGLVRLVYRVVTVRPQPRQEVAAKIPTSIPAQADEWGAN